MSAVNHSSNHGEREQQLKRQRKYDHICQHFLPLFRASINARYLLSCSCFDEYLTPSEVTGQILKHHLHQVETSAIRFLKNPTALARISSAF